ncbi:MAG: SUMF1/EgtB/PvdO family nonheme iron enzyme [Nitrospinaceae bacterium]|nr:SUMF1/EgtB/PvdO family nonheme iron enzyme [Nitrospinaceae bacterium]MBT3434272.1 SUMF1/EgtB/PvdO family nonheme iron enzyme [Nitrospinaceae bacterium]MBT3819934.1 SUMF1/EgtB/PvdO family nonheme iron enzyme [Nitrospinaceae bacterium]MBT4093731.1 SUMF1/EgtB/PvdO family nonheme iron enzyme [Nitrospinaceae bacterium]MBT4430497.1 SUMF1/EgtB/PvdO family nonheme iron enzyme [Nitrospinaceae bacterium]
MGSDRAERDLAYRIGSNAARKGRWFDAWELPRKQLFLKNYFIDKNLVTQSEYQFFVRETGHPAPFISPEDYQRQGYLVHPYKAVRRYLWLKDAGGKPTHPAGLERHPVVLVSRLDGEAMCAWRRGKSGGKHLRLPTEAEWEKAARGTQGAYFPWGNRFDPARLNHAYHHKGTTPIGTYTKGASPYGVLDMAGNVFEWTSSDFDPGRGVMKGGGSWDDQPGITRAASRHGRSPRARHLLFGFRCMCEEK